MIVSPKPYKQMQREFAEEIARLAELAFGRYCRNNYEALYLVGTKTTEATRFNHAGIWSRLAIASESEIDARPELIYVRPEPISRSVTLDHLGAIIRDWLSSEPLYIFAD